MFLSTFRFNPARRGARKLLESQHVLHAAVLAGFPDPSPTETGRVLWRLDRHEHSIKLYIVSPHRPDLTHLAEQAGWPTLEDSWGSTPYQPLLDRLEADQHYAFRLTANPTHSVREDPGAARGKVRGHLTVAQQQKWFLDRQERLGIAVADSAEGVPALVVSDRGLLTFRRRETEVILRVATYEGTLRVTDPEALRRSLTAGIGRAKGYGCGLLTLAPVS